MSFSKGKIKDFYLLSTDVENMFINEYLPAAPGEYVKVYLYGLLYAQLGQTMSHQTLTAQLKMTEGQVAEAWDYWEKMGVVRKVFSSRPGPFSYDIEFVNLREKMYSSSSRQERDFVAAEAVLCSHELKSLMNDMEDILGRTISREDGMKIQEWLDMGAAPEMIREAASHCSRNGKKQLGYIAKVVDDWNKRNLRTAEEVREHLKTLEERYGLYKKVLLSLGMSGAPTAAQKKMIDKWTDEMGFNEERILAACDTTIAISNPNFNYVNKVLENWRDEAVRMGREVNQKTTVTQAVLNKYYDYLRQEAETAAQVRREEVYEAVPQIKEIDQQLQELGSSLSRGMLSGMTKDQIEIIRGRMRSLDEERAVLLTENNFTLDYTEIKYSCDICADTGIDENGQRCVCSSTRTGEAEIWQNQKR